MKQTFDYVVVGAGTAGCVLASRLSEDPKVRVLLLEAGVSDTSPLISIPLGMGKLHEHSMYDWADPSAALRVNDFTAPLDLLWAVSMEKDSTTPRVDQ